MLFELTSRRAPRQEELVELLSDCHRRIRYFATLACEVARREDVPPEEALRACSQVERYFREALPLHVDDEEKSIAPRLRGASPELDDMLARMIEQHDQHTPKLARLLAALGGVRGAGALTEPAKTALLEVAEALRDELEEHLALEERVLFPAINQRLPAATRAQIIDELRARRAPSPRP